MSVEAHELTVDVWTRWQGHVVGGVYPLGRFLGGSAHSGVFLTKLGTAPHGDVAIKLFPTNPAEEQIQIQRWNRTAGLAQSHLLPLFQWGGCQLDGLPYLYVVMEYADQTLAQLLLHRALTTDETRQMLLPILEALKFLHGQDLVHGQLKPSNIMVVGDQLKLSSEAIRAAPEGNPRLRAATVYDSPEGQAATGSREDDIWALGVCLFEALTRRRSASFDEHADLPVLPPDFPPAFRDVVARCLSPLPQNRPSVTELLAWAGGDPLKPVPSAPRPPAMSVRPEPRPPQPAPPRTVPSPATSATTRPPATSVLSLKPRTWLTLTLASIVMLALGWTAMHVFGTRDTPDAASTSAAPPPAPVSAMPASSPAGGDQMTPTALHEVIPDVPRSASRTIRGHVKVSVQATVEPDGSVSAVVADRTGPSKYFRRLAAEAAKQWRFAPLAAAPKRPIQIQFDFSRDGTTGRAVALH